VGFESRITGGWVVPTHMVSKIMLYLNKMSITVFSGHEVQKGVSTEKKKHVRLKLEQRKATMIEYKHFNTCWKKGRKTNNQVLLWKPVLSR